MRTEQDTRRGGCCRRSGEGRLHGELFQKGRCPCIFWHVHKSGDRDDSRNWQDFGWFRWKKFEDSLIRSPTRWKRWGRCTAWSCLHPTQTTVSVSMRRAGWRQYWCVCSFQTLIAHLLVLITAWQEFDFEALRLEMQQLCHFLCYIFLLIGNEWFPGRKPVKETAPFCPKLTNHCDLGSDLSCWEPLNSQAFKHL